MKSSEVIQMFKDSIAITKSKGIEYVPIENLEEYAQELKELVEETPDDVVVGDAALEEYRARLTDWISSRQYSHEMNLEMLRSVITVGQSALRSAVLINGGAAVAMLAFIGKIWGLVETQSVLSSLALALFLYVSGVLSAAMAAGATYISQAGYANGFGRASRWAGVIGQFSSVFFVIGGYALFGTGSWMAFKAIGLS